MNESNNNFDTILKIAAKNLVEKDLELAKSINTSNTVISKKTLNKVRRRIKNYEKSSWWNEFPIACRRIVAAVLVVCTMSFAMCLSVKAVRTEIVNTILEWYDKFVSVFYVTEVIPPNIIEVYREPMLQISDTEKEVLIQSKGTYQIVYLKNDDISIQYHQSILTDESKDWDSENGCTQANIKVNNYDAVLFSYDDGSSAIIWHDNEYSYYVCSYEKDIDSNLLVLIAESVQ